MKKDKLQPIYDLMPEGWQAQAKELKALQRGRNIGTAEELLRLIFLYQTTGDSYGLTAALTQISENQTGLSKQAVQHRIISSGDWLKWLCENICREKEYLYTAPEWLKGYRVCVVDASNYSKLGSNTTDFRLHYMMELFNLNMTEHYFTDASEGEKLTRYQKIQKNDLILADRAYATLTGIAHLQEREAHYVMRLRSNAFNLYREDHSRFDLTEELKDWQEQKNLDLSLYYKIGKEYMPIRVCASAKTPEDVEKSNRHTKTSNTKEKRGKVTDLQSVWNRYIVVVSSLPESISFEQILELYRMRWQIELVFKRFKSIFGGGQFSSKREDAVKAWFYGKLLLAIVCEVLVQRGHFSPSADESGSEPQSLFTMA